jgi:hypothetical protein
MWGAVWQGGIAMQYPRICKRIVQGCGAQGVPSMWTSAMLFSFSKHLLHTSLNNCAANAQEGGHVCEVCSGDQHARPLERPRRKTVFLQLTLSQQQNTRSC